LLYLPRSASPEAAAKRRKFMEGDGRIYPGEEEEEEESRNEKEAINEEEKNFDNQTAVT